MMMPEVERYLERATALRAEEVHHEREAAHCRREAEAVPGPGVARVTGASQSHKEGSLTQFTIAQETLAEITLQADAGMVLSLRQSNAASEDSLRGMFGWVAGLPEAEPTRELGEEGQAEIIRHALRRMQHDGLQRPPNVVMDGD